MITREIQPLVSVIVPVYNAEPYLRECLDSILAQDIQEIEIITVDDGSKDGSPAILDDYAKEKGIKVIHQENGGPSKARNAGLAIARGKYVGFVDADDWIEPNMYSRMVGVADDEQADIVFCNIFRNQSEKMRKYLPCGTYRDESITSQIFPILISSMYENVGKVTLRGSTCLRIFRRELLEKQKIRFNEGLVYNEDGLFCIQATVAARCYVYIGDDYLYHNRYTQGSLTKRYIPNLWNRQKVMYEILYKTVKGSTYDFSTQIDKKLLDIAIYCIENECKADTDASAGETKQRIGIIIKDEHLQKAITNIPLKQLKRINKGYWLAVKLRFAMLAMLIARHRDSKHKKNIKNK